MVATQANMRKHKGLTMYCPDCGIEYSGNAEDYFMAPENEEFRCGQDGCDGIMQLGRKVVTVEYREA